MRHRITVLAAAAIGLVAMAPASWGQMVPETNPALAPARNPSHPTSSESLAAQAQDLTRKINEAKAQGKDTSAASAEQSKGEKSMQQGNEQEALQHFNAGEQALGAGSSRSSNNP